MSIVKNPTLKKEIELEQVEMDGKTYSVKIEATGTWADVGIGPWEHFGNRGTDSRIELDEITFIIDPNIIEILDDGETREFTATAYLLDQLENVIYEKHEEYIREQLEEESKAIGENEP